MGSKPQFIDCPFSRVHSIFVKFNVFKVVTILSDELLKFRIVERDARELQKNVIYPNLIEHVINVHDKADYD